MISLGGAMMMKEIKTRMRKMQSRDRGNAWIKQKSWMAFISAWNRIDQIGKSELAGGAIAPSCAVITPSLYSIK